MLRNRALPALLALFAFLAPGARAQHAPEIGPRKVDPRWHALVHATVVPRPGESLADATVVVRDGAIVALEAGAPPPAGARVWDCSGLFVYPGLIDAHLAVETPRAEGEAQGRHWRHEMVTPQRSALDGPGAGAELRKELRALGFTAAAIAPSDGVFRGRAALVALGEPADELSARTAEVIADDVFQVIAFRGGGFRGGGGYPTSEMGAIALVRQTLLDADHHARSLAVQARDPNGHEPPQPDRALEALAGGSAPLLFDAADELQILRAAKVAAELGRELVVVGCGTEFRRLEAVAAAGAPIVLPLSFPEAPDVATRAKAEAHSLRDLMTWEQAPTNPRRLLAAGLTVALTTDDLESRGDFPERLRKAIAHGLAEDDALAMLTTTPARLLGVADRVGQVAPGMLANLVVADGALFAKDTKIRDVWVGGRRYEVNAAPAPDRKGEWRATFERLGAHGRVEGRLVIGEGDALAVNVLEQEIEARRVELDAGHLHFQLDGKELGIEGVLSFSGLFEGGELAGTLVEPDGTTAAWSAAPAPAGEPPEDAAGEPAPAEEPPQTEKPPQTGEPPQADEPAGQETVVEEAVLVDAVVEETVVEEAVVEELPAREPSEETAPAAPAEEVVKPRRGRRWPRGAGEQDVEGGEGQESGEGGEGGEPQEPAPPVVPETWGTPFGAYGLAQVPAQRTVVIHGATIWTASPAGILHDATLVIEGGRVRYVGPRSGAPAIEGAEVVEGAGKHVTPGLIDCHSHTGIGGGVNEMGRRVTAEVRVADVIDPDDISFYRQLAGGLTAANQLHGSGNAIGGQNSVVKLRWGVAHPDDMRLAGAPPGIKLALGENPKRVAAGNGDSEEYPQTRMGVEALIRDRLCAGRDYRAQWAAYEAVPAWQRAGLMPPRRDLELEALAEVVAGQRLVHCHSYRQDEILMLTRVAREMGFTIGTFQHVLEGYKVAEAIEATALGASTFADWWAYKFEVIDAIPFNAAIMSDAGVVVSINSDSDEHARRLNTEAAKSIKYGGMEPHEALKLVTINPAIQLGVAERVGSLEIGKDADFVIWSGDPMSYGSRCEATWIDGRECFSLARDRELREEAQRERQRIVQKLLREDSSPRGGRGEGGGGRRGRPGRGSPVEAELARLEQELEAIWRGGIDPELARPGECGCGDLFRHELLAGQAANDK